MSAIYRYRYIYTHTAHSGVVFTPLCAKRFLRTFPFPSLLYQGGLHTQWNWKSRVACRLFQSSVPLTYFNIYYYQYTRPNRKSASSKHTFSGPQKTDSGLLSIISPTAYLMIWSDFEFVIHLACIIKTRILDIIWPCLLIIMIMTWLFSGILFICALVVSFAARARKWHYAGANKQYSLKTSCYSLIYAIYGWPNFELSGKFFYAN